MWWIHTVPNVDRIWASKEKLACLQIGLPLNRDRELLVFTRVTNVAVDFGARNGNLTRTRNMAPNYMFSEFYGASLPR